MICPKCFVANDDKYTFCTECGTPFSRTSDVSSEEIHTVVRKRDELEATQVMPPQHLPPTELYSPSNTNKNEPLPTEIIPPQNLPPTFVVKPEEVPPTQYYSPPNTDRNNPKPTQAVSSGEVPPTMLHSNQRSASQFVPPKSAEPVFQPNFEFQKPATEKPKKKSRKILLIAASFLLLLLVGGGAAVYFLAQPMQANKSYSLTDNHTTPDNTLHFDNQSKTLFMVAAGNDDFQKWQITPDPADKTFYRFVNRGLGENQSLEVIDDTQDSSVSLAQTANDVGQLWAMTNVNGDNYRITNKWLGDGKSLAHTKQYHYFLRIRDSGSGDAQLWKKIPAPSGQGFYLVNKQHGDSVFLQALKDGEFKDKLVMKSGESGNRQWNLNDLGNGFHTLTTTADNKSLEINTNNKDRIIMSASANSAGQRWKMTPVGNDYFRLTNESLGDTKSLEVVTFSRFVLEMVKSSDTDPGQLWKITRIK